MNRILVSVVVAFVVYLVLLWMYSAVKTVCHECLAAPVVAQCDCGNNVVSVQVRSNREPDGYIKRREFAGCRLYWHENPHPE